MENYNKKILLFLILQGLLILPSFAIQDAPVIYSITPQYIQQGQITTVIVTGENLPNIVGVTGDDVYAVILKRDVTQKTLAIQLAAKPTALGPRNLLLRNEAGVEATFPFQVTLSGSPTVDNIIPAGAYPGDTTLVRLAGKNLTSPFITTLSEEFTILSTRPSSDGSVIDITVSLNPNIAPGSYPIIISTPYGQAEASFTVLNPINKVKDSDSFNADPYSPGIYSIEFDPSSKKVVLKGSMFDSDPSKNTVTLLENNNGTVIGRQVDIASANNNEIVINLPGDVNSDSISFAVSSSDGKSSNIKSIDLESLTHPANSSPSNETSSDKTTSQTTHTDVSTVTANTTLISTTTSSIHQEHNQGSNQHKPDNSQQDTNKQNESPSEKINEKTEKASSDLQATTHAEDANITQNIKNLSQYLFTNSQGEIKKEAIVPTVEGIKDPARIISTIEENKQIKNQADLIMLAINEAKQNQELSETLKKSEVLKSKVEELEKLLTSEKQKNNPNPRKLAKYQQLLQSASAESRSQTFALLNNLLQYKPQLKNLFIQKPFDLAAIQPNIPNDSVILQYIPTEEGLIIFVVDNKNLKTRINKNITKDVLNKEVQAYRQLFENEVEKIKLTGRVTPIISWKDDKSNTYKKEILPLKEKNVFLYNALIAPIENDIANKRLIAVIANGWLRYLPFQSLAKPTKDGDLKFLISDKSIVYLDSVIAISKDSATPLSNMASITVFANPDGTLNGANKEAEVITMLFSMSATTLVQRSFTVPLINQLAKKADIIHLATHGYLDSKDIESSYLVSGKKQQGKNTVQEKLFLKDIYDLNLNNSKLVVLSGCDTGKLGNLLNEPDDIVGSLATAFRVAGANTILASLWKAHDDATKIIMQNFYENLKLGLDKAESLRRAELKLKENPKYSHPLFWSLFNLIGDWR
ncbi:MAG: CHAT domain-containing protein [Candidatus Melainabacteria bacterium]|nr:CHAT domain-containing protein [Candidatus Melainabacteria bacterium]